MSKKKISNFNSDLISLLKIDIIEQMIKFSQTGIDDSLILKLGKKIDHNFEKKMCRVRLYFDFFTREESEEKLSVIFHIDYHFLIGNFDDCMLKEDEKIMIDTTLTSHLLAIAYSTSRGILHERLSNTPYKNTILPIINPYEFLKKES